MEFAKFIEWAFYGIVSGSAVYAVSMLGKITRSIEKLNINVAVIVEKISGHEKILDRHEIEIVQLKK